MSLACRFELCRGNLDLEVELTVARGETLALVGPNGAGKSTLLQAVAGLVPLAGGSIRLDGRTFDAPDRRQPLEPSERCLGVVFQDRLLFPHLSALDNVAFGPLSRGATRRSARATAAAWLERVGLGSLGAVRAAELSGGQAQRVAVARALASQPAALLFDEPLSAVDAAARAELRRELRAHLAEFEGPRVVVAHDAVDAFALADRVAVLEGGRIVQTGTTAAICAQPRSAYVADLVGLNLFRGRGRDGRLALDGGGELVVASLPEGPALAAVHPRAVALFRERPAGSPRNVWRAAVAAVEPSIDRLRVRFEAPVPLVAEVTHAARDELRVEPGGELWVAIKATEIAAYTA